MKVKNRREECIQARRRWLASYRWTWFLTLKITSGFPSCQRAKRLLGEWISALRAEEGGKQFRYAAVFEKGTGRGNPHFHVLVGGLRNRRRFWAQRWREIGGEARIEIFNPDQQGILYMLKGTDDEGDINLEFELPPPLSTLPSADGDRSQPTEPVQSIRLHRRE